MNEFKVDPQRHADVLQEAGSIMANVLMLAEGLDGANVQLTDKDFINAAAGALGLMAPAMNTAFDLVTDAESNFRMSNGLCYGKEVKE